MNLSFLKNIKFSFSLIVVILITLSLNNKANINNGWSKNKIIVHDTKIYYAYLPAFFIHNDFNFKYLKDVPFKRRPPAKKLDNGNRILKTTCGNAVMQTPAFLLAHAHSKIKGEKANGYSDTYDYYIAISAIIYALLAMLLLRKILANYFNDWVVGLVLISIVLASNIYFYIVYEPSMTHIHSFFLYAVILNATINWHKKPSFKYAIYLGLAGGLATLIRPTNLFIFAIPFFYGMYNKESFLQKFNLVKTNWKQLIALCLSVFIFPSLQIMYWYEQTGNFMHYSYGEEAFYFGNSHVFEGLFSFRNGFFTYAPLMLLSVLGLYSFSKKGKELILSFSVFFPIMIFVSFSWWCWWYAGSFGNRALSETVALMAIPLGFFYQFLFDKIKWSYIVLVPTILFCSYLLSHQAWQHSKGIHHYDSMTWEGYKAIFLKNEVPKNIHDLLNAPDYINAKKGNAEYTNWTEINKHHKFLGKELLLPDFEQNDSLTVTCEVLGALKARERKLSIVLEQDGSPKHYERVVLNYDYLKKIVSNKFDIKFSLSKLKNNKKINIYYWYTGETKVYVKPLVVKPSY